MPRRALMVGLVAMCQCAFGCAGDDDTSADSGSDDDVTDDDSVADDDASDDADDDTWPPLPGDDDPVDPWAGLSPSGLPVGEILGMATQMNDDLGDRPERNFEIEKLVESGLLRLRASVDWGDVEPAQDAWEWEQADAYVDLIVGSGLRFDGRVCYGIDWARPDGDDSAMDPADFADYAGAVAGRYCDDIKSWEVWNEENHRRFWKPEPDPDAFGALMKATYVAVHDACPDAQVVFGGMSCLEDDIFTEGLYYFLERVAQAHPDIADYFDVLAIHPYTFLQQPSPEMSIGDPVDGIWPSMAGQVEIARRRLETIGGAGKPIWLTEWGWPSLLIGQEWQARYYDRGALLMIAQGVEALDWYTFYDGDGGATIPTEDHFGLFTSPAFEGGPREKPVYRHALALSTILGASRYAGDLAPALDLPPGAYALGFVEEETGARIVAGWTAERQATATLDLPAPPNAPAHTVYSDEGEVLAEGNGAVSLTLGNGVQYVRFDAEGR